MKNISSIIPAVMLALIVSIGLPQKSVAQHRQLEKYIAESQIASLEAHFDDLHQRHQDGLVTAKTVRDAFAIFSRTLPATQSLAMAWVEAEPKSAYAHAALGWSLNGHAWRLRGGDFYQYTWPAAVDAFDENTLLSQHHAKIAYSLAPDLIAASDLMLLNEVAVDELGPAGVLQIVDHVMANTPNRGTLVRAANAFNPRWGNDITYVEDLCLKYAKVAAPEVYTTPLLCAADLTLATKPRIDLKKRALKILKDAGWQGFEQHRYDLYADPLRRHWAQLEPDQIAEYLGRHADDDTAIVQAFYEELILNTSHDASPRLKALAEKFLADAQAKALESLATDPGNRKLVELIMFPPYSETRAAHIATPESRIALWGDVLRAAPYDASLWDAAATSGSEFTKDISRAVDIVRQMAPLQINAIAYSNHQPRFLRATLFEMVHRYDGVLTLLPRDDPATARKLRANLDTALACPIIRTSRLFKVVCNASPNDHSCNISDGFLDVVVEKVTAHAETLGICSPERNGAIAEIVYYPVDAKVGSYHHQTQPLPSN